MEWYAKRVASRSGLGISVNASSVRDRLPERMETALFRIAQEALTNVTKHAKARHVAIHVDQGEDTIQLVVEDDGVGFQPGNGSPGQEESGWGLSIMRERALSVGGVFSFETPDGGGTRVEVEIPL
jgi:signal transduction histidine kinase